MDKKALSERDTCTKFITSAICNAGWDKEKQIQEEVSFTNGKIYARGMLEKCIKFSFPSHRTSQIVAKVEALMMVCDKVDQTIKESNGYLEVGIKEKMSLG
jgi:hypothetical protein